MMYNDALFQPTPLNSLVTRKRLFKHLKSKVRSQTDHLFGVQCSAGRIPASSETHTAFSFSILSLL